MTLKYLERLNTSITKDLGLTISANVKVSEQCGVAASKVNQIIGMIKKYNIYRKKANYTSV